jgi:hypothetical protein
MIIKRVAWRAYCIDGCDRDKPLTRYVGSVVPALREAQEHEKRTGHLTKIFNVGFEEIEV